MTYYNPQTSILVGMTVPQLQTALAQAQAAYAQLMSGQRAVTLSYSQGDGSKSVTYDRVNMADLMNWIRMLQMQLGIPVHRRRPLRFRYA